MLEEKRANAFAVVIVVDEQRDLAFVRGSPFIACDADQPVPEECDERLEVIAGWSDQPGHLTIARRLRRVEEPEVQVVP